MLYPSSSVQRTKKLIKDRHINVNDKLTPTEVEVSKYMCLGLSNKEIAIKCGITEHVVKFHTKNIITKLNTNNRTQAVVVLLQEGYIKLTTYQNEGKRIFTVL